MKKKKVVLNLGCGGTRIPGSIGIDSVKIDKFVDIVHDLEVLPYPFKTNSVDEIHLYHVLEHLKDPIKKMEELHRILTPGGIIHIRVPHFSSLGAFSDITHIRPYGYGSFNCFEKNDYHHYYSNVTYKILKKEIKYFGLYPNSGDYEKYIHPNKAHIIIRPLILFINFAIALSPTFFERIWCYWVGGAMEVNLTLQKV